MQDETRSEDATQVVEGKREKRYFASNKLCVVVYTTEHPSVNVYDEVQSVLNIAFTNARANTPAWKRLGVDAQSRIQRPSLRVGQREAEVVFPPPTRGGRTERRVTAFQFHEIAHDVGYTSREREADALRAVIEAVNGEIGGRRDKNDEWEIQAVTPQWLATAAEDPSGGGSPGAPPEPVEDDGTHDPTPASRNWTFRFEDTHTETVKGLNRLVEGERERFRTDPDGDVVVAVLDTCPLACYVEKYATAGKYRGDGTNRNLWNWVLDGDNKVRIDAGITPADAFPHAGNVVPDYLGAGTLSGGTTLTVYERECHFGIADHGLFVAGIVKDIAPRAKVHLIRVLDATGMGDLAIIVEELQHLLVTFKDHLDQGKKLIVNLSLTVTTSLETELTRDWYENALPGADFSLREAINLLTAHGVLVIAAAGNDSYPSRSVTARFGPMLPARYENVLGVSALNADGEPASYANEGDADPERLIGVATYGGNATRENATAGLTIAENHGKRDAVVGIYSTPTMPGITGEIGGEMANTTGWAYWAGTSFATPIITGIAANLWAQGNGPHDARAIIEQIRGLATLETNDAGELSVKGIKAWQVET